jgi:hypothetical protein
MGRKRSDRAGTDTPAPGGESTGAPEHVCPTSSHTERLRDLTDDEIRASVGRVFRKWGGIYDPNDPADRARMEEEEKSRHRPRRPRPPEGREP